MTTTNPVPHDDQRTMTMASHRHHQADSQYRTTRPSTPTTPTRTDTCQLFEQATAPARAERC